MKALLLLMLAAPLSATEPLGRGSVTEPYGEEMPLPKSVGERPASDSVGERPTGLSEAWRSAVRAVETRVYARGGFAWESEAESAALEAESGLRAAGLPVLSVDVAPEAGSPKRYAFALEYVRDSRAIESFQGASFDFESDARAALNAATSNLTAAGYHVILARVLRADGDYTYAVDFVARRA